MNHERRRIALAVLAILAAACSHDDWRPADRTFVAQMIPHHHLGMRLIDDATVHSADVRLRGLVFEMSGYHQSELETLEAWATEQGVATADEFPGDLSDDDVASLQRLTGTAHDIWWLELMIRHHRGALTIADSEITGGGVAAALDMASNVRDVQTAEIAKMDQLRRTLCAEMSAPEPNGCG